MKSKAFNVACFVETYLQKSSKINIPGYSNFGKNRSEKGGGGVLTCILDEDVPNTLKIQEGRGNQEYLVTRHDQFSTPINIINVYGPQECRVGKNGIEELWNGNYTN